jgi:L-2,4-diaminobutyrate decarboxylase
MNDYFLNEQNRQEAREIFMSAIDTGIDFKLQEEVRKGSTVNTSPNALIEDIPQNGKPVAEVQREFNERFLPFCSNFSSSHFMGFPDAGNSIAAMTGSLTADLLQQNLINQSFCSPSGTFAEISVIRWLRDVVGYSNPEEVNDIFDIGGIVTGGGTTSNTIGILMAREHHKPGTMAAGVGIVDDCYLIVPKGIGHYSVKSAQMWIGCGNRLLEVETNNFRYDLEKLEETLNQYKGKIMGLIMELHILTWLIITDLLMAQPKKPLDRL